MRHLSIVILTATLSILFKAPNAISQDNASTATASYQLIWFDEFNTDGAIDTSKWFAQTQLPAGGNWYNGEVQHYTSRIDNSIVENGYLKIIAKRESYSDQGFTKDFTSARLNSKFAFKYGKVEVRAKLPSGVGTWPAIWTLGKNIIEAGAYFDNQGYGTAAWPACGEIDIMEHWGSNQNYVQSATHTPSSYGGTVNLGGQIVNTASSAFHIYTLEWTAEKLVFSVDNVAHYTYNPAVHNSNTWPFDLEQYLLLNVAILPSIYSSFTSSAMEIDYVRIYQENGIGINEVATKQDISIYPNPFNSFININLEDANNRIIDVRLYSIEGKLLNNYSNINANNNLYIDDLDKLSKGVYILQININNIKYIRKIFKN